MKEYIVTAMYTCQLLAGSDFHAEAEVERRIKTGELRGVLKTVEHAAPTSEPEQPQKKRKGLLRRLVDTEHGGVTPREEIDRG